MFVSLAGFYGLVVGSFLNAAIWRAHEGKTMGGRSACPKCGHQLSASDLVPVLSWLLLGGRCRYCRQPISWQYPAVELLTAVLFALSVWRLAPVGVTAWLNALVWLVILAGLIFLFVYDLKWYLLPNVVTYPAIVLAAVWLAGNVIAGGSIELAYGPLLAALASGGGFLLLALAADGKLMGMGDVKLVVLMGLVLGLGKLALALFLAFNVAAVIGLVLILLKRKKARGDYLPFGPFLVGATVAAYLYGNPIIDWYLRQTIGF